MENYPNPRGSRSTARRVADHGGGRGYERRQATVRSGCAAAYPLSRVRQRRRTSDGVAAPGPESVEDHATPGERRNAPVHIFLHGCLWLRLHIGPCTPTSCIVAGFR